MNATKLADEVIDEINALSDDLSDDDFNHQTCLIIASYLNIAYNKGRVSMCGLIEDGNE